MKNCENFYFLGALLLSNLWQPTVGYQHIRLQNELCAADYQRQGPAALRLIIGNESAAIVEQTWNTTLPDNNSYNANRLAYDCQFSVQTSQLPYGVYIVIRRLKFRTDSVAGCLDYIEFSGGQQPPSGRICTPVLPSGRLVFDQRAGAFNVRIHIDTRSLIEMPLELGMVFTAHAQCKEPGDIRCDPRDPASCIARRFVCDNITNCPYTYRDEEPCVCDSTN